MVQFSVQGSQLSEGYAAFNADTPEGWAFVESLFCKDTPNATTPEFPAWYQMHGEGVLRGRAKIFAELRRLRATPVNAQLLKVVDQGSTSITLDYTTGGPEGTHACADKVEFDEFGLIKVFWHCSTNTHKHGHAGHPEGHPHPPGS